MLAPASCDYWRWGQGGKQENINAICILALNHINDKVRFVKTSMIQFVKTSMRQTVKTSMIQTVKTSMTQFVKTSTIQSLNNITDKVCKILKFTTLIVVGRCNFTLKGSTKK